NIPVDPSISTGLRHAAEATLKQYPKLTAENLAISVVDLTNPATVARGDFNGDARFYPASVIKLFFMADVYHQRKESWGDADRALKEMIVVSDNDATAFLVDILTDTCSGSRLSGRALRRFIEKRKKVNRYFESMNYDVSAMMKPWSFGPFGRDVQALGENRVYRNRATANGTASLLLWIVRGRAVSSAASKAMMDLMERPLAPQRKDENQVKDFIGEALPTGTRLWSKAGWTSEVRHDAAYLEFPGGKKIVLVIYTRGVAGDTTLLPAITRNVMAEFGWAPAAE
ncbi:MAG TPA: serine hydrolase, partial [Thermoanaerobaculia bacterium]|nr:serine hydrolase [Thermoanaerobaculia bacterium]